jgi:hypothetical protein
MPTDEKKPANAFEQIYEESQTMHQPKEPVEDAPSLTWDDISGSVSNAGFKDINIVGASNPTPFSAPDLDRYLSYGTETYGKLGYNPFIGAQGRDEVYNDNTGIFTDVSRAWTGMWKLAGIGFQDTFAFGAFADEDRHKDFDKVMQTYSSSRGGGTQFFANTMLSSGYTIGIMAGIAAEELGIGLLTGGLGLVGGAAKGIQTLSTGKKVKTASGAIDESIQAAMHIENARAIKAPTRLQKIGQAINPIGESLDFIRNYEKLGDLNKWQKSLQGAASLARDARKI